MNIIIVGLGGIGTALTGLLCRYLNYLNLEDENIKVTLVDGDEYEQKNIERQDFMIRNLGNKAEVKLEELEVKFQNIEFDCFTSYVNQNNMSEVIEDNSIIFLCLDNHKSRMIINNYCKTLTDVTLISGGNEMIDGNVQLYVKKGGIDLTPDLCTYHPEIADPADKLPDEMSCEELAQSEPQLLFTNAMVAAWMCCMFLNAVFGEQYDRSETYFDIKNMIADSKIRKVN